MQKGIKWVLVAVLALFAIGKVGAKAPASSISYLGDDTKSRGIRNNNPGNLRITGIQWQGKVPLEQNTDGAFEQFISYVHGVRAMLKDLTNDYRVDGMKTLTKLISAYAPSSENNTNGYIMAVSNATGLPPSSPFLDNKTNWRRIVKAMAHHENGVEAVTDSQFDAAWSML